MDTDLRDALMGAWRENPNTPLGEAPPAETDDEGAKPDETAEAEAKATEESGEGAKGSTEESDETEGSGSDGDIDPADIPDELLGVDLSDLSPEQKTSVFKLFKDTDKYANKKAQESAAKDKELEALRKELDALKATVSGKSEQDEGAGTEDAPSVELPSDQEIVAALGWDADDELVDVKLETIKPVLSLMQSMSQQMSTQMNELSEYIQLRDLSDHWNSTLDELEAKPGAVEVDREELVEFAVENNIEDPSKAYETFVAPRRDAVREAADTARREALLELKRQIQKGEISAGRDGTDKEDDIDSVEDAVKAAEKETGTSLASLFKFSG